MKFPSQSETPSTRTKLFGKTTRAYRLIGFCGGVYGFSGIALAMIVGFSPMTFASDAGRDLRDSCRNHFAAARQSEAQLETLKSQPLRMVRIGGELDVALYDRLALVRRQRIAAASVAVRTAQSALSGCLAKQLTVQQTQRMPANVAEQPIISHAGRASAHPVVAAPPIQQQVRPQIREQVYVPPKPIRKSCDPETAEYGCTIEEIRVAK